MIFKRQKINKKYVSEVLQGKNYKQGFVMIFAVALSSVILALALGLARIALKEVIFSTSAKHTNDAFFAADTGAECALFHDLSSPSAFGVPASPGSTNCAGISVDLNNGSATPDPVGPWTFVLYPLGGSGDACAKVTVIKTGSNPTLTQIISKGYSSGGSTTIDCSGNSLTRVERGIELNY